MPQYNGHYPWPLWKKRYKDAKMKEIERKLAKSITQPNLVARTRMMLKILTFLDATLVIIDELSDAQVLSEMYADSQGTDIEHSGKYAIMVNIGLGCFGLMMLIRILLFVYRLRGQIDWKKYNRKLLGCIPLRVPKFALCCKILWYLIEPKSGIQFLEHYFKVEGEKGAGEHEDQLRLDDMNADMVKAEVDSQCDFAMLVLEDVVELVIQLAYYYYKTYGSGKPLTVEVSLLTSILVTFVHVTRQVLEISFTKRALPATLKLMPRYKKVTAIKDLDQFKTDGSQSSGSQGKNAISTDVRTLEIVTPTDKPVDFKKVVVPMLDKLTELRKVSFGPKTHSEWQDEDWRALREDFVQNKERGSKHLEWLTVKDIRSGHGIIEMALLASRTLTDHAASNNDVLASQRAHVFGGPIVKRLAAFHQGDESAQNLRMKDIYDELMKWDKDDRREADSALETIMENLNRLFPANSRGASEAAIIDLSGIAWGEDRHQGSESNDRRHKESNNLIRNLVRKVKANNKEETQTRKTIHLEGSILAYNLLKFDMDDKHEQTLTVMQWTTSSQRMAGFAVGSKKKNLINLTTREVGVLFEEVAKCRTVKHVNMHSMKVTNDMVQAIVKHAREAHRNLKESDSGASARPKSDATGPNDAPGASTGKGQQSSLAATAAAMQRVVKSIDGLKGTGKLDSLCSDLVTCRGGHRMEKRPKGAGRCSSCAADLSKRKGRHFQCLKESCHEYRCVDCHTNLGSRTWYEGNIWYELNEPRHLGKADFINGMIRLANNDHELKEIEIRGTITEESFSTMTWLIREYNEAEKTEARDAARNAAYNVDDTVKLSIKPGKLTVELRPVEYGANKTKRMSAKLSHVEDRWKTELLDVVRPKTSPFHFEAGEDYEGHMRDVNFVLGKVAKGTGKKTSKFEDKEDPKPRRGSKRGSKADVDIGVEDESQRLPLHLKILGNQWLNRGNGGLACHDDRDHVRSDEALKGKYVGLYFDAPDGYNDEQLPSLYTGNIDNARYAAVDAKEIAKLALRLTRPPTEDEQKRRGAARKAVVSLFDRLRRELPGHAKMDSFATGLNGKTHDVVLAELNKLVQQAPPKYGSARFDEILKQAYTAKIRAHEANQRKLSLAFAGQAIGNHESAKKQAVAFLKDVGTVREADIDLNATKVRKGAKAGIVVDVYLKDRGGLGSKDAVNKARECHESLVGLPVPLPRPYQDLRVEERSESVPFEIIFVPFESSASVTYRRRTRGAAKTGVMPWFIVEPWKGGGRNERDSVPSVRNERDSVPSVDTSNEGLNELLLHHYGPKEETKEELDDGKSKGVHKKPALVMLDPQGNIINDDAAADILRSRQDGVDRFPWTVTDDPIEEVMDILSQAKLVIERKGNQEKLISGQNRLVNPPNSRHPGKKKFIGLFFGSSTSPRSDEFLGRVLRHKYKEILEDDSNFKRDRFEFVLIYSDDDKKGFDIWLDVEQGPMLGRTQTAMVNFPALRHEARAQEDKISKLLNVVSHFAFCLFSTVCLCTSCPPRRVSEKREERVGEGGGGGQEEAWSGPQMRVKGRRRKVDGRK